MKYNLSPTELSPLNHLPIDKMNNKEALLLMLDSHDKSIKAVGAIIEDIEEVVESIYNQLSLNKRSRLIYVGAGTSGRIAVQDGAELYPTFGWPKSRLDFIIAGGMKSLVASVENAEDDILNASKALQNLQINKNDIIIALAASGNTPFTSFILKESYNIGALTVGISNNPKGSILNFSKHKLFLNTGAEVVEGSTRLKAGTSQKICLNLISTLLMIKLGYVKNGKMINLVVSNKKLRDRKMRIQNEISN